MLLTSIDLYLVFIYLMAVLAIGLIFSGRNTHPDIFMAAKRSLPGWLVGFSIFATMISNITVLGVAGKVFGGNIAPLAMDLALPFAIFVTCKYFIPMHCKNGFVSAYSHFEKRFGLWAATYSSCINIIIHILRVATITYLIALALGPIVDINQTYIIVITGLVVLAYTYLGGIEAVIWTDFLQAIIFLTGLAVTIGYVFMNMPEGASQVIEIAQAHNKFDFGSTMDFDLTQKGFWTLIIFGFTIFVHDFGVNQTIVQRYIATSSPEEAKRALWRSMWLAYPLFSLVLFTGIAIFAFYTYHGDISAAEGIFEMKADSVLPHFIATQLPVGVRGLLIAAILASAMSSIDSSLNSIATLFHTNIYVRFINRHPGKKKSMRVLHLVSIITGLMGIGIAMTLSHIQSIFDSWWLFVTFVVGTLLGLFLLGVVNKRADGRSAKIAVGFGSVLCVWLLISPRVDWIPTYLQNPANELLTGTITAVSMVIIGSLFAPREAREQ